ncbi:hypothetical protein KAZ82_00255 [Candidatus Babeliales bacterium]|nr:hypothetical protein [Candidatus Babeliales bacterium]
MNKSMFFSAIFIIASNCFASDEVTQPVSSFDAKYYSCVLKIQPKSVDGDMQAFNQLDAAMRELIDGTRAEQKPNLFELFLNFVKEVKEAVMAGMNLFITVENHQESLSEVVQDLMIEEMIAVETQPSVERVLAQDEVAVCPEVTETAVNKQTLSVIICCACSDESQVAAYEALKSKLELFASDMNNQNVEDLVRVIAEVYEQISNMPDSSISLLAE